MILYLLKMIVCSSAFYALYALLFQRERMLVFNRIYLLAALVLSFGVPLISITVKAPEAVPVLPAITGAEPLQSFTETSYVVVDDAPVYGSSLFYILGVLYVMISVLLLLRFSRNIKKLHQRKVQYPAAYLQKIRLVLLPEPVAPHSFLNTIFLNKQEYEAGKIKTEIIEHERAHIKQKHSWDILFIELLQIMTWFNPVIYLYKRSVKINHELLADAAVVKKWGNVHHYQRVLLQCTMMQYPLELASHFTFYITKKRLIMLNKKFSKKRSLLLGLAVIPLLAILVFFISERVYAQTTALDRAVVSKAGDTVPSRLPPPPPPPFTWETQHKFSEWPVILEYFDGRHTISSQLRSMKLPKGAKNLVLKASDQKVSTAIVVFERFKSVIEDVSSEEKRAVFEKKYGVTLPDSVPRPTTADKADMLRGTGATDSEVKTYETLLSKLGRMRAGTEDYKKLTQRVRTIYGKMTEEQKKSVRPLEPLPPPPPPASARSGAGTSLTVFEIQLRAGDTLHFGTGKVPSKQLLRELPELVIDSVGNMTFNGRRVKDLLVDGRPFVPGKTVIGQKLPGSMTEMKIISE